MYSKFNPDNFPGKTVVCLLGATATGKTELAIELSRRYRYEIISVDSAMIYRGMDIGTAKPKKSELAVAPHALIDICDPKESYSVSRFCQDAKVEIERIFAKGATPLLVGGSMLYFHGLLNGLTDLPVAHAKIRDRLTQEAKQAGWQSLHERLKSIDPDSYKRIKPADSQRIQRALEVYELTGKTITECWQDKTIEPLSYNCKLYGLVPDDRAKLHDKISSRFQLMLDNDFLDEVQSLYNRGDLNINMPSIRCVGYRQAWQVLEGNLSMSDFPDKAIAATRQLAKRQITWLRGWDELEVIRGNL